MTDPIRNLLTIRAVAKRLAVSERTVRRMISRGDLVAYRIGAQIRIAPELVDQYLLSRLMSREIGSYTSTTDQTHSVSYVPRTW